MKDFVKEIKKEVASFNFEDRELKDLAIIKHVLIKLSQVCIRDDLFFLYKEDLFLRRKIYNKRVSLNEHKNTKISCKSYCILIQKVLKHLRVRTVLFSAGKDEFKHFALIYINGVKKYYIDPLHDLVNFKVGADSQFFCSKYDKIPSLTVLKKAQHREIDKIIGFREKYNSFLLTIKKNVIFGDVSEIIKFIMLNSNFFSVADTIIFLNKVINDTDLLKYKEKIEISYCVVLKNIRLKDKKLRKGLAGLFIQYINDTIFYFPTIKYIISNSNVIKNIYIKPKFNLKIYRYLRGNDANRQVLDNIYFQKLTWMFENKYNLTEKDFSIIKDEIFIKSLNIKFSIYKHKYLCLKQNYKIFYFKIKFFGAKVIKHRLR